MIDGSMNLLPQRNLAKKILLPVGTVAILALAAAPSYYFYQKYQKAQLLIKDPELALREEKSDLISKVSKLIELPITEEPTIATISDAQKIKDQPFFAKAENGDKVLIYTKQKKAYLYRPSNQKLVDVAPINLGTEEEVAGANTKAEDLNLKLALYNGTQINGLTKAVDIRLLKNLNLNYEVTVRKNAVKTSYIKTLVVDLSEDKKFSTQVKDIAGALGGEVIELPKDEQKPQDADVLIIAGPNLSN